ncbi:MAG TPA: translocation/assembly module TamB domain-containing protein [Terriglobales bacterium]|nr:translocation/assembly module TamB domain-containing protein [Terriglobales bacterium]
MKLRRIIGWTLAILVIVVGIGAIGRYFYLRSDAFRQFAIRKIVEQANQATGGRTQIGSLDFKLSTLTAHLCNVVIRGNESPDAPPLLQLDKLTVAVKIQSVLHRKINLSELLIDHPVVHLQVNSEGKSNIPQAPPSQSSSQTNIFELAVGHTAITRGEINYNDRKTPLDADLYDLGTDITFEPSATRYRGSISYDRGQVRYGEYAPLRHSFNAQFRATPTEFSLESAVMKVASSSVNLHANVTNYSNPAVAADYEIRIHTQDLAAVSPSAKATGDVSLSGKIHYQSDGNRPFLRSIVIEGQMGSEALSAMASGKHVEVRKLKGRYRLADGTLRAQGVEAELLDGRIDADVDMTNLDTTPSSRVRATLHGISLGAAEQTLNTAELKNVVVSGSVDGTVEANWTGNLNNLRARSDLAVRSAKASHSASAIYIPVDGVIHAAYDGPTNVLTLRQTTLRIPSTTLTADGQVSNRSKLEIHATADDLHQLVALASAFASTATAPPPISGSANLSATLQGSVQKPEISGKLTAQNLQVQGSDWKSAELSLQANPSRIVISNGTLVSAHRGQASFGATMALRDWSYPPSNSIQANLSVRQMSLADLEHLANVQYPVSGNLSANVSVSGSQLNPAGSGSVDISNARVYDEPVQTLALKFHTESESIVSTLNVATSAGSADASLTFTPKTKAYKVSLDAPAIVLQKLQTVKEKNLAVNGTLTLSARGQGTLDDPQLTATLQLPRLDVKQKSIAGLKAEVNVANKQANLTIDSQVAQAAIRARGHVNLTGDYETDASIDTASIPLDVLLATYASSVPEGFKGQTELHATVKGPLKDKTKLEAHLTIPTLSATYQSLQIGAAGPIRADYSHSVITLQPAEIRGTDTSIRMQGIFPLAGNASPTLTAQGSIDARIVRIFSPDVQSSGTVALDVRTSGSASNLVIQGQVRLQDIAMATPDVPVSVDKLNGVLELSNERVQISSLAGEVNGGQISAGGSMEYRPSLQFNIALQGKSIRLRYPEGLRTLLDSNLAWTGTMQGSTLTGQVLVDQLGFTPDFDLSSFGDQFSSSVAVPAQPGLADTIKLQVTVQSKNNLNATSKQVSMAGSANLNVIGTAANPVIIGRADLDSGELFYRNVRYQLLRGIITFDDPNQTSPVLDVSVSTTIEQYNLTLNLRGPFDRLTTSYTSDPPLATADIINLIALGKTTSESAASSQSTDSIIASQAASQVSGGIQKLAGISALQINPLLGGNSQNPSAQIALQQRVTKNFLFTFSTDVSQPGQEIVQGDYQINQKWSVSVARDQLGGVSVDGRYHTKF